MSDEARPLSSRAQRMGLTDTERRILDFAGRTYRYPGAREADVLTEFGWSAVRHAQVELALIDRVEAWEYAPGVVKRLRARRDRLMARRTVDGINTEHARVHFPSPC